MYPLQPESIQVIQMVSSLPFDRNAVTPSSSTASSAAVTNATGAGGLNPAVAATGMFGQSMFPHNFYQQPNMFYGGADNLMIGPKHPMMPMNNMMTHLLQQQQQFQQMLQYQQLHQQQQQLQAISNPSISSPVPQSLSPSSSYTQRKPINTFIPMNSPISHLQVQAAASTKDIKPKNQQQPPPPAPSTSISAPPISKVQRKQVKSAKGKRRVRFTDAKPQVKVFVPDSHWIDEEGKTTAGDDRFYNEQGHDNEDGGYYDDNGSGHYHGSNIMYDRDRELDEDDYYDDDDDTMYSGAYEHYDESDYDQRHYPDHYYNQHHDDYDNYDPGDNDHGDDDDQQYTTNNNLRPIPRTPRYQRQVHYDDDHDDNGGEGLELDYREHDRRPRYYYYDDDNNDDDGDHNRDNGDDYDYWNDGDDDEPEEIQRPWSTGRYMEYERSSSRHLQQQQPSVYYSPTQQRRVTRHSSARAASTRGPPPPPPPPQQHQQQSPLVRRSTATAATPSTSSANPRMWQPSRGSHLQQQWNASVSRSSSTGASTSRRYRSVNG